MSNMKMMMSPRKTGGGGGGGGGGTMFGLNSHELMFTDTGQYSADSAALNSLPKPNGNSVNVWRVDLIMDMSAGSGRGNANPLPTTSVPAAASTNSAIAAWAAVARSIGYQPLIVCTWTYLAGIPQSTMVAAMSSMVSANPGIWWEWGNELHYFQFQPGTGPAFGTPPDPYPPTAAAANYIPTFAAIVTAVHNAAAANGDTNTKIGPAAVANIDNGGDGWQDDTAMFANSPSLATIPYDFFPFHNYPDNPPDGASLVSTFVSYISSLGNTKPYWQTEGGWQTSDVTPAVQASYTVQYWQEAAIQDLAVVVFYDLLDDSPNSGPQYYGWWSVVSNPPVRYTGSSISTAKPVVAAMQAVL